MRHADSALAPAASLVLESSEFWRRRGIAQEAYSCDNPRLRQICHIDTTRLLAPHRSKWRGYFQQRSLVHSIVVE